MAEGEVMRTRWLPTDFYTQFMFSLAAPSWMFSMKHIFLEKYAQQDLLYTTDSFCVWHVLSSVLALICPFLLSPQSLMNKEAIRVSVKCIQPEVK